VSCRVGRRGGAIVPSAFVGKKVNIKVKFNLVQATKAQRGSSGVALLFT
jgi:hypothetical protein